MNNDAAKQRAAEAAINMVEDDSLVGVGTGSTVNFFIDALAKIKGRIEGAVSSSDQSTHRLRERGIAVIELNASGPLPLYVDGADEIDRHLRMIKGGGGALTREKIVAAASETVVCIADETKLVDHLGTFPVPIEVIPMARSHVGREIVKLGGQPVLREGFTTDNGNLILDVHQFDLTEPSKIEKQVNCIAGVVTIGIFSLRSADILLLGNADGFEEIRRN